MAYGRYSRSRRLASGSRGYGRNTGGRQPARRFVRGGGGRARSRNRASGVSTVKIVLQQAPQQAVAAPVDPFNALKADGQASKSKY